MKRMTDEEFKIRSIKVHGDRYDYSKTKYIDYFTKVRITCFIHGDFYQRPSNHLQGQRCYKCGYDDRSELRRSSLEKFKHKAIKVHGDRYGYDKVNYIDSQSKIILVCKIHGDFEQIANNHLNGRGCILCHRENHANLLRSTKEEFTEKSIKKHGDLYDYSLVEYHNRFTSVNIICKKHGIFSQKPNDHINGSGCPQCKSKSRGERIINLLLREASIEFKTEYTIPNAKPRFRYDFYLPDHNVFIEFHGIQHYRPIDHFGGEEEFRRTRERDILKRGLADMMKIKIIYLNYNDLKLNKEKFKKLLFSKIR